MEGWIEDQTIMRRVSQELQRTSKGRQLEGCAEKDMRTGMIRLQVRQGESCWLLTLETMFPAAESASDFTAAARIAMPAPPLGRVQSECGSVKRALFLSKTLSNPFRGWPSGM